MATDEPIDRRATGDRQAAIGVSTGTAARESSEREYLRIRPTNDSLSMPSIDAAIRRLHRLARHRPTSLLARRRSTPDPPTIECLLVSDGNATVDYYVGIDDTEARTALERTLRGLFPDTFEFEHRSGDPISALETRDTRTSAVEFVGETPYHPKDWQLALTPFETFLLAEGGVRVPLATIVETMAERSTPMVYQALLRPMDDWSMAVDERRLAIEANTDTLAGRFGNALLGPPEGGHDALGHADRNRLEALAAREARSCFDVTARIVAFHAEAEGDPPSLRAEVDELSSALVPISGSSYLVEGVVASEAEADAVLERLRARSPGSVAKRSRLRRALARATHRGIVADSTEVPSFFVLGGDGLTVTGSRAIAPTPGERTALARPPTEQLESYRKPGLTLGHPLTHDGRFDTEPIALPPALQPLHAAWFGKTGSGKSTSLITAILDNHAATDGASILIDPKGGGMPFDYLQAHYRRFGHLEDVIFFDCTRLLPAFSFFDIRADLEAGLSRTTAVEDRVDHYLEILRQVMGREPFDQAVRSPDVIQYLVKGLFDPVNGIDAFSHRELHQAARVLAERQAAPAVSDDDLEEALDGIVSNSSRTFTEIMAGVTNRIEKISVKPSLARIFNHVPEGDRDPHLDLASYLDRSVVIVFDTGGLRSETQRALALVILSNLWSALKRRTQRQREIEHPLVNLYLEEAASIANSNLVAELLAQSRGFACSVTLSMQFPAQLRSADIDAYAEVLNNVSTVITGNVPSDRRLAERLATDDMGPQAVGNRLRGLRRGQWLATLPAAFDAPEPRPFLLGSCPPAPGTPASERPLTDIERTAFEAALEAVEFRTLETVGLTLVEPEAVEAPPELPAIPTDRVDTTLPYTRRLPTGIDFDRTMFAVCCLVCDSRYDPTLDGVCRAVNCHGSMDDVDYADIPICNPHLKLSPEERARSPWSDRQLLFVQCVYDVCQRRVHPLEYNLLTDSMLRIMEYVGIDAEAVSDLLDTGLIRLDTSHPHRLYSVTPAGRKAIGESYHEGIDYGHGLGDLDESAEHIYGVEVAKHFGTAVWVDDPDSDVVEIFPYYDLGDGRRLDLAGLDTEGNVCIAFEVERLNHDTREAVPADFDKMAESGAREAIWVVSSRSDGHAIIAALHDPPDGEPRVPRTYAENSPLHRLAVGQPGMSKVYTTKHLINNYLDLSATFEIE